MTRPLPTSPCPLGLSFPVMSNYLRCPGRICLRAYFTNSGTCAVLGALLVASRILTRLNLVTNLTFKRNWAREVQEQSHGHWATEWWGQVETGSRAVPESTWRPSGCLSCLCARSPFLSAICVVLVQACQPHVCCYFQGLSHCLGPLPLSGTFLIDSWLSLCVPGLLIRSLGQGSLSLFDIQVFWWLSLKRH